jgi:CheY-like chemotaxis protein/signal transduction histidine kinase
MSTINKFDFAIQIRQALQNLHDYASLQKLPLSSSLSGSNRTLDQGVRLLRSEILAAIEQLNPTGNMPQRAKERRPYALLYGCYVQGMTTAELVEELAISIRQLRRENARALDAVTELLWTKLSDQLVSDDTRSAFAPSMTSTERIEVAQTEAEQLISQAHVDDLALPDLIDGVLTTLASVARGHNIALVNRLPNDMPLVRANRVVIRQCMMGLLSYVLQHIQTGQIIIESSVSQGITLQVNALGKYESSESGSMGLDISQRLISSLGGKIVINATSEHWHAEITLPLAEDLPVLIMDDNAGLIELFRRYLAGGGYRVFEAHIISEAIEIARKADLKLIILDVMMPEQDGWEILQRLKEAPETKSIPVMICSVLNEPEIAHTLGASDYLPKPVTQDDLLAKVERWCRAPLSPLAPPKGLPANTSKSPSM